MPRNSDEALEWPEEVTPDLSEVIRKLDLEVHEDDELVNPTLNHKPREE